MEIEIDDKTINSVIDALLKQEVSLFVYFVGNISGDKAVIDGFGVIPKKHGFDNAIDYAIVNAGLSFRDRKILGLIRYSNSHKMPEFKRSDAEIKDELDAETRHSNIYMIVNKLGTYCLNI